MQLVHKIVIIATPRLSTIIHRLCRHLTLISCHQYHLLQRYSSTRSRGQQFTARVLAGPLVPSSFTGKQGPSPDELLKKNQARTCTYTHVYIYTHTHRHRHTHAYIYIYIHIYIYIYIITFFFLLFKNGICECVWCLNCHKTDTLSLN